MYICICNAIRETDLREAARHCSAGVEAVYISLGRPPQCRQCIEDAEEVVEDERRAHRLPTCL